MIKGKKVLAIIPARAGSKRVKNKNLKKICSKPLIYYSLAEAKKSKFIDKIFVSTDSRPISKEAGKFSLQPEFLRPKKLSTHFTNSETVILHLLKKFKKLNFAFFVLLQPTSPLRTANDIDRCIKYFGNKNFNTLVSVKKIKDIKTQSKFYLVKKKESKKNFKLNGAIYISSIKHFLKKKNFNSAKIIYYIMSKNKSLDIDTHGDFKEAKKKLLHRNS